MPLDELVVRREKGGTGERVAETFEAAVVEEVGQHLGRGVVEGDHHTKGLQQHITNTGPELVRNASRTLAVTCAREKAK